MILAPCDHGKKGEHLSVLEDVRGQGFVRVRVDGDIRDLSEDIELGRYQLHTIEVVVDRIALPRSDDDAESRRRGHCPADGLRGDGAPPRRRRADRRYSRQLGTRVGRRALLGAVRLRRLRH